MRIALGIEYEGWNYAGFQKQKDRRTVQGELEHALGRIACGEVSLQCAGRTDAGVSATGQVAHFDTDALRPERGWVLGANGLLPSDIALTWARIVSGDFHARFSARARRYRYLLLNTEHRSGILRRGAAFCPGAYDVGLMAAAAQCLRGEHDFAAFSGADDESRSTCRCVHYVEISRRGPYIVFDIAANAFLNHMVRNLVGSLLCVGSGRREPEWLSEVLKSGSRDLAGPTASPDGLYLVDVVYPREFGLPRRDFIGPLWLP